MPHFNFMSHFIAIFVGWSLLALLDEISVDAEVMVSEVAAAGNDNAAARAAMDKLNKFGFIDLSFIVITTLKQDRLDIYP